MSATSTGATSAQPSQTRSPRRARSAQLAEGLDRYSHPWSAGRTGPGLTPPTRPVSGCHWALTPHPGKQILPLRGGNRVYRN